MRRKRTRFAFFLFSIIEGGSAVFGQNPSANGVEFEFVSRFGGKGDRPGQFSAPHAVSVDPSGFVYVADTGNNRIQKFDPTGQFVTEIGGFGWGKEQFNEPVSLWAENGLDVFVADYDNQRIARYDKDLHFIGSLLSSEEWPESLRFGFPLDVSFTAQSELFCLDGENRRVLKLDVLGNPQISFGGVDSGDGRLVTPRRVTVTPQGRVYASDEEGGRVLCFDTYGNYLLTIGAGVLEKPQGMAESPNGKLLFVADTGLRRIHLFRELRYAGSLGDEMLPGARFIAPVDVACWKSHIYVLDRERDELLIFRWLSVPGESAP
jgi:DNA-binding beta-propeller fold protein YncE